MCRKEMGVQLGSRFVVLVTFGLYAFSSTAEAVDCPAGWVKYVPGNTCIYLSNKEVNFNTARSTCTSLNAKLVKITDSNMNAFLHRQIISTKSSFYTGLNDLLQEKQFAWNDERNEAKYTNWAKGEPNDYRTGEDCVIIYPGDGLWNDVRCADEKRFICQKPPPPPKCPGGWAEYVPGNTCIYLSNKEVNFNTARSTCTSLHAKLVKITDSNMNAFLHKQIKDTKASFFIGLNDLFMENNFAWNDEKTPTTYNNWVKGEPNDYRTGEDCVIIYPRDGLWNDAPCADRKRFICQKAPPPPPTTTTKTTTKTPTTTPTTTKKTMTPTETTATTTTTPTTATTPTMTKTTFKTTTIATTTAMPTTPSTPQTTVKKTSPRSTASPTPYTTASPSPYTTGCPTFNCSIDCGLLGFKPDPVTGCFVCECDDF